MSYFINPVNYGALPAAMLDLAKVHCRVDFTDDDATIAEYLEWAISYAENVTGLRIFGASVEWLPDLAVQSSREKCPVQPVSSFTASSGGVDVSSQYRLEATVLTAPVWFASIDGTPIAADALVTLGAGYSYPAAMEPGLKGNILRITATLYEHRESVSTLSPDAMPFFVNDMLSGTWITARMKRARTTALITVDNPEFATDRPEGHDNPRVVEAVVNLRESSIISLARAGVIDADQVAAAWRFRKAWETTRSIRPAALSFEEKVRTGHRTDLAERRLRAAEALGTCRQLLGEHGYDLVSRVCGDGYHIRDIYETRRERDTATDMMKIYLDSLAELWRG